MYSLATLYLCVIELPNHFNRVWTITLIYYLPFYVTRANLSPCNLPTLDVKVLCKKYCIQDCSYGEGILQEFLHKLHGRCATKCRLDPVNCFKYFSVYGEYTKRI